MSARERFIQEMEPAQATSVLQSRKMEGQSHLSSFTSDKESHELEFALLRALFSTVLVFPFQNSDVYSITLYVYSITL